MADRTELEAAAAAGTADQVGRVLILGAGWRKARAIILKHAPRGSLMSRIFPPEALE